MKNEPPSQLESTFAKNIMESCGLTADKGQRYQNLPQVPTKDTYDFSKYT